MKILAHQTIIEDILEKHPRTRDNDVLLYFYVCKQRGHDLDNMTGMELLKGMNERTLPFWETISRCRRKIQEQVPELRGKTYQLKQTTKQEEVKEELGYGQGKNFQEHVGKLDFEKKTDFEDNNESDDSGEKKTDSSGEPTLF